MYTLEVVPNPDCLHVRVRGRNTRETVREYLHETLTLCAEHKSASLLVEEHLEGPSLPVLDMVRIATVEAGEALRTPGLQRIAYVDTNPEHAFDQMALGEDIARARGLHMRLFRTVVEGLAWIRDDVAMTAQRRPAVPVKNGGK